MNTFYGSGAVVDWPDFGKLVGRLLFDLAFATIVIRLVYYRLYRSREFIFTYYLFNLTTLFMCLLLRKVPTELGVALALFGVFGILRYRTEQIRIRDLTYLFIVIGLGVLNGIANKSVSAAELVAVNGTIVGMTAFLELRPWKNSESSLPMFYDRLELLRPGSEARLLEDLRAKTGLGVVRVEMSRVDFLRDAAELTVFYREVRPTATPPAAES